jgi:hypothetical protein
MLPPSLVEQFWEQVSVIVRKKCRLSEHSAHDAVARFRIEIEPKVGEMIYHDGADNVAKTVISAVKNGEYLDVERKGA